MNTSTLYHFFFPDNKKVRFAKLKWTIMVILQEIMMGKWKAIIKYFIKPSYHKDINKIRGILCKGKMQAHKTEVRLCHILFSHEINYPAWVIKLMEEELKGDRPIPRIKVFALDEFRYVVIDGNHRLKAKKLLYGGQSMVKVLELRYKS